MLGYQMTQSSTENSVRVKCFTPLADSRAVDWATIVEVLACFLSVKKVTRLRNIILKGPIRERFIERGDVELCFSAEWSFRSYR